jgi:protein-L-isoaspartate(D-aspartate) O-methyltransferase
VENLKEDGKGEALQKGEIIMVAGDGRLGYPQEGKPSSIFSSSLAFF